MATDYLTWAVGEFVSSKRLKGYTLYERYYSGDQPLAFATEKYRTKFWRLFKGFADNMCQSVVDVQAERLEVSGFTSSAATVDQEVMGKPNPGQPEDTGAGVTISVVDDPIGESAWGEWEDESMPLIADQIHQDAFLYGDAFVIADEAGVWRQEPSEMAVRYSKEQPGVLEAAAKCWTTVDGLVRLNVYTQDGLTKYQTARKVDKGTKLAPAMFKSIGEQPLPAGIPVTHFANKTYGRYGLSELAPVIPLQDALNKSFLDMIVSMEYQAFRQRWITGVDVELDETTGQPKAFPGQHGAGNFLSLSDPEAKVGEFGAADLAPYVKVINDIRGQIARVSGIPLYYFFVSDSGATASGESLKVSENRFTRKGARQQRCFGKVWELTMDLVLELTNAQDSTTPYDEAVDLNVLWAETSPRSESEELDVLVKKSTIGVPNSQLQREAGYDPDEIQQFAIEYAENIKLGLQAAPTANPQGQTQVPVGATPGDATSQVSATPATAPPAS